MVLWRSIDQKHMIDWYADTSLYENYVARSTDLDDPT